MDLAPVHALDPPGEALPFPLELHLLQPDPAPEALGHPQGP